MTGKHFSVEQIIKHLRKVDVILMQRSNGQPGSLTNQQEVFFAMTFPMRYLEEDRGRFLMLSNSTSMSELAILVTES